MIRGGAGVCAIVVAALGWPGDAVSASNGHARPRAVAVDAGGKLVYVALSTANALAVLEVSDGAPHLRARIPVCEFPNGLAVLPRGGVVVSCRFDRALRVVVPRVAGAGSSREAARAFDVRAVDAGPEHGHQGIAVDSAGRFAYVASPPRGGVKIVDLQEPNGVPRFVATGLFPRVVRVVSRPSSDPSRTDRPLLLVSNAFGHTVTVHAISVDGGISAAIQTISTHAPVLDMAVVGRDDAHASKPAGGVARESLWLLTYEDRPLSRAQLAVEGLDSVVLALPRDTRPGAALPFVDAGIGRRESVNLTERSTAALVGLETIAIDPLRGQVALAGAGSDNVLLSAPLLTSLRSSPAATVGANPTSVAFLPDGTIVTADRLSDTVSMVKAAFDGAGQGEVDALSTRGTISVGEPARRSNADLGELLFYSRALVPHNVATGPLSVYTCAACHIDGQIDGRLHPSKRNRFFSMTKSCRGLRGTEPFLSLGKPATFAAFADNILSTHAQGALTAPDSYDQYSVQLRVQRHERLGGQAEPPSSIVTLSPGRVRSALAAYLTAIPREPSPYVDRDRLLLHDDERRGLALFRENCAGCHQLARSTGSSPIRGGTTLEKALLSGEVTLTSAQSYDVGTPVLGDGGNNPPSLRAVWAAAPYFSDGSAPTLDAVLLRTDPDAPRVHAAENARRPPVLSAAARRDLLAFLRAL